MRIAVKDIYNLEGLRTSLSNRAYFTMQQPASQTATALRSLLSAGVNIIGKTYMSAFALIEHPTQSIEYEAPFNPRGDGYQIPGGSSGGSAVAVASYNWVDLALATDS